MSGIKKTVQLQGTIAEQDIAHRAIADKIREKILRGEFAPGEKLPSTMEIAARWNTSKSTAHTALARLVKDGILERHHGSCTYVSEQRRSLDRIGVYYDSPQVWSDEERGFFRSLQGILEQKLKKEGIEVTVFVDRRPVSRQAPVFPAIRQAIFNRSIQGLIAPISNAVNLPALRSLPLPVSILTSKLGVQNRVSFDDRSYFREIFARLAENGCQSVGFITSAEFDPEVPEKCQHSFHAEDFIQKADEHGMVTKKKWIRFPRDYITKRARFGYREFHKLWSNNDHPEALLIYPDIVVQGAIHAILELGAHQSKQTTFCFHRNAHLDIICPFPALWTITDESKVADALIAQVRKQNDGEQVSPIRLPFEYGRTERMDEIGHEMAYSRLIPC